MARKWSMFTTLRCFSFFFFFQAEDGIRDVAVTGVQTCALPILQRMGVDVRVLNLERNRAGFERGYPDNALPVLYARNESDVAGLAAGYDAVVATWSGSVGWLGPAGKSDSDTRINHGNGNGRCGLTRRHGGPVRGYYVQDFEPEFY